MMIQSSILLAPYGGQLVNLLIPSDAFEERKMYASQLPSVPLTQRVLCDLELLATGGFSPLDRFMNQADYTRVVADLRLANGTLFPIPVTLPVELSSDIRLDRDIALRDDKNNLLAIMTVEEIYPWQHEAAAQAVFGTLDERHPLVAEMARWGQYNLSGRLEVLALPQHYDFRDLRLTPAQTRERLERTRQANVIAFQTRNPLHRVHEELTKRAMAEVGGALLLHPSVGMTKPGDVDHYTRVRTYQALVQNHYEPGRVVLALLPLAMRLAGPREAVWHAIIRRNFGANHLIVGRDHASPGSDSTGKPFYGAYDAHDWVERYSAETGVRSVAFQELVYLPDEDRYEQISHLSPGVRTASISGTQVRDDYLNRGRLLPTWFTHPEVADILAEAYPPRHRRGVCIWFTGLSGAGKSTTAAVLELLLLECGRRATVLDGDIVRAHLSKGLGFSKEDRDANIRRIGFVAAEIVKHGGLVICAAISPYQATRAEVRSMVGSGQFVEVFVDTPLEECERRDTKGLYAQARRGEILGFTGIDDPYEPPRNPEIRLETLTPSPEENARRVLQHLVREGFIRAFDANGH